MPILVTCNSCKAQFNVSEKFAGKQGPCPKCKALITIPKVAAQTGPAPAAPPPEVKIHAPDAPDQVGKTSTGKTLSKPLLRTDARLTPRLLITVAATTILLFLAAWFGGSFVQAPPPLTDQQAVNEELVAARRMQLLPIYGLRAVALLLIGFPIVLAGYAVLRDDELEPYRGRSLWLRTLICVAVFVGVWGMYLFIPDDLAAEPFMWIAFLPILILPAAVAAYYAFELDYVGGLIHACFFFLVTLLLGWTAGLTMPWHSPNDGPVIQSSPDTKLEVIYQ